MGSIDLFLEEVRDYARRLEESGVSCVHLQTDGAFHGFVAPAPNAAVSRASTRSQMEFLRQRLGLASG